MAAGRPTTPPPENAETRLSVLGHLEELRRRILWALGAALIGTVAGLAAARYGVAWLQWPVRGLVTEFILIRPTEIVVVYLKVAAYLGLIVASPVILYQAWQFFRPALAAGAHRYWAVWLVPALVLFGAGTGFAYFMVLPTSLSFLMRLSREVATPLLTLNFYISFALAILTVCGLMFEIPILAGWLTRAGLISPRLLRRRRREVIFALFVLAAVLTPTTDVFSMLLFVAPMAVLYEIGIGVSALVARGAAQHDPEEVYPDAHLE